MTATTQALTLVADRIADGTETADSVLFDAVQRAVEDIIRVDINEKDIETHVVPAMDAIARAMGYPSERELDGPLWDDADGKIAFLGDNPTDIIRDAATQVPA